MNDLVVVGAMAAVLGGCVGLQSSTDSSAVTGSLANNAPMTNASGAAATFNVNGTTVDLTGPFFQSFGTNGRVCGSCHAPQDGWTVIPAHVQARFDATGGTDPIFRTNDGSVSPNADVSTVDARRAAYAMLLSKGDIRVGIGVPAKAEFTLSAVDDPYGYASAAQLSLFRRPLPSANLFFLSTVMWDGRETFGDTNPPTYTDSNCVKPPFAAKCFRSVNFDLSDQANGATRGHAAATMDLTTPIDAAIVDFETSLMFAQISVPGVGDLSQNGGNGGPQAIAGDVAYFGINDNFGDYHTGAPFSPTIFNLYDAWTGSSTSAAKQQVARGQAIFNNRQFTISGVGGLNGALGLPASFTGTCGTCHDTPNGGNHSVPAPLNIGISDASRRTADMPLYTFTCSNVGAKAGACVAGQTVQTTDPGRALITGKWADMGKFKGPTLRGLAARAPYFHNGSAADINAVIDFYDGRFGIGFSAQEKSDLAAFLAAM